MTELPVEEQLEWLQNKVLRLTGDTKVMRNDIARLEGQMMGVLKPKPKEPEPKYTLQHLRENWLAAERRADSEEAASLESGGILSDVCDIAFEDENRAMDHSYDGICDQVRGLAMIRLRWFRMTDSCTACEGAGHGVMFQFRCGPGVNKVPGHPCLECDGMGRVPKPADPEPGHHDDCGTKHRGCAPECKFQEWHRAQEPWQERWDKLRDWPNAIVGRTELSEVMDSIEDDT